MTKRKEHMTIRIIIANVNEVSMRIDNIAPNDKRQTRCNTACTARKWRYEPRCYTTPPGAKLTDSPPLPDYRNTRVSLGN